MSNWEAAAGLSAAQIRYGALDALVRAFGGVVLD